MTKHGEITVFWGTMFTGKSTNLIANLKEAGDGAICFKPYSDNRDEPDIIKTHDGLIYPVTRVEKASEILLYVKPGLTTVGIEEASLFFDDPTLIPTLQTLREIGIDVFVTGLDMDRHGVPFYQMPVIAAIADNCFKLRTRCSCGEFASLNYYKGDGTTFVARDDMYEPLCRTCFSKQEPSL